MKSFKLRRPAYLNLQNISLYVWLIYIWPTFSRNWSYIIFWKFWKNWQNPKLSQNTLDISLLKWKKKQLSFKTDIFLYGIICRPLETVGVSVGCKGAPVSLLLLEWKQQLFWFDREHHFLRNASGDSFNYLQSTNSYSSLFLELCPKINFFKCNKKVTYLKILILQCKYRVHPGSIYGVHVNVPFKSLNVYDFGMKMYTYKPITAQLFL